MGMGAIYSKIRNILVTKKDSEFVIIGLDNAGKTCILYTLCRPGQSQATTPTIGFNVETVEINNVTIHCYDLGGQTEIRNLWKEYLSTARGLVFVIDYQDTERYGDAKEWLKKSIEDATKNGKQIPLLILLNKVDYPDAPDLEERVGQLCNLLELQDLKAHWKVFTTSTQVRKENPNPYANILKAFEWLIDTVINQTE